MITDIKLPERFRVAEWEDFFTKIAARQNQAFLVVEKVNGEGDQVVYEVRLGSFSHLPSFEHLLERSVSQGGTLVLPTAGHVHCIGLPHIKHPKKKEWDSMKVVWEPVKEFKADDLSYRWSPSNIFIGFLEMEGWLYGINRPLGERLLKQIRSIPDLYRVKARK